MDSLVAFAEVLLSRLGWTSVQATALIGVVWLLGRLCPRLPASCRSLLWWLLGVQLLLGLVVATPVQLPLLSPPTAMEAATSVPIVASVSPPAEHHVTGFTRAADPLPAPVVDAPAAAPAAVAPKQDASPLRWPLVLLALWLTGVLLQLLLAARQWMDARAVVRLSQPLDDPGLQAACALQARSMGLRRCPSLRVCDAIASPQVTGLWRPTVLLPARQSLSAQESALALAHELAHLRRGDLWMGWVPAMAQRLFFFHPLVGWAMREYALHREAACDAQVVQQHAAAPQDYGRLLLRLGVAHPLHASLAGASPTFNNLRRRLTMLQHDMQNPMSRARGWLVVALVAMAGVLPYRVTQAAADPAAPAAASSAAKAAVAPVAATRATPAAAAAPAAKTAPATQAAAASRPLPASATSPAAMTPPAPPAPPSPPAAVAPLPPAPPPLPPLPPLPSAASNLHARHVDIDINTEARNGFALFDHGGDTILMNGTEGDISAARLQRKNDESLIWFRRGQQAYVIRDAATIERARTAYAPMHELATIQSRMAGAQARLAGAQARLAARDSVAAARMGALAAHQGQLESQLGVLESRRAELEARPGVTSADLQQVDTQIRVIDNQIKSLAERQQKPADDSDLRRQQADIERQQGELERQQHALELREHSASAQADGQMDKLLDEAIAKGIAQPVSRR
ncbi:M56 family metallopeptidase [Dyella soli]|uniref:Peptidase M56 n=1 Tax=Dyella soli TaxID=522319 RepID=A0A4R0YLZ0_9GAMM|nr:M56 family metallopeptidase [Dyella soli]TCI06461.1 peptidase M56 [Dyella soli]